ncbi:MAG TPA: 4Fe-4S binding protein [Candidatus Fusicatenibacter merdavium]|uniref:4Fe-4S binding protein n=1 Tax=Candidatus Fusicatenibacter merdavium TaxID=2838600 RepID=A0A9D1XF57_9FIRM|nr:4Fe-4S binding protein [Candidatus Fusicatenibacter merdavium]
MESRKVKNMMFALGADLCGIASVDRFSEAPKGYHPCDVLPECKSVISFACRFPAGTIHCSSPVPYTRVRNSITAKLDQMALDFCIEMEKIGIVCVPIPVNESQWDETTGRWRSVVSLKHAAQAAGLGTIGRHSLVITPEFGSMIWLGAVLCEQELEPDERKKSICDLCGRCVEICPVHALENSEMEQMTCWEYAFGDDQKTKSWNIHCHKCRDICPYHLGTENSWTE